jgi:hypothetical protein
MHDQYSLTLRLAQISPRQQTRSRCTGPSLTADRVVDDLTVSVMTDEPPERYCRVSTKGKRGAGVVAVAKPPSCPAWLGGASPARQLSVTIRPRTSDPKRSRSLLQIYTCFLSDTGPPPPGSADFGPGPVDMSGAASGFSSSDDSAGRAAGPASL